MIKNKKELYKIIEAFEEKNILTNVILLGKNDKSANITIKDY